MTDGFTIGVDRFLHREDDVDETPLWTECRCLRHERQYWSTPELRGCPDCQTELAEREQDRQRGAA